MRRERTPSWGLVKLSEAVAKWRERGGGRGLKIPDELWNEAVRVARVDGVWRTAKETRLKYDALKQRLTRADGGEVATAAHEIDSKRAGTRRRRRQRARRAGPTRRRAHKSNEFVELGAAQLLGAPSPAGTVIEMEDQAGVRITVRLTTEADVDDVAQLLAVLRRRRA